MLLPTAMNGALNEANKRIAVCAVALRADPRHAAFGFRCDGE